MLLRSGEINIDSIVSGEDIRKVIKKAVSFWNGFFVSLIFYLLQSWITNNGFS